MALAGSTSSIGQRRTTVEAELEQPAQRGQRLGLVVDQLGVVLEDVVAVGAGGVLQLEHGLGVEEVVLALAAPLVLATELEPAVGPLLGPRRMGEGVAGGDLGGDLVEPDATEAAHGAGEVLVDEVLPQPDGLEHLRPRVGRHRGDAHLRHDLQHALAGGLDVAVHGVVRLQTAQAVDALVDHVLDGLEREVRVDGAGAVAEQERHVVHLASVAALDDETHLRTRLLADEVVVHGRGEQQRRDWRVDLVAVAVRKDDDAGAVGDGLGDLDADGVEGPAQCESAAADAEQPADRHRLEARHVAVVVDADDLGEVVVVDDGERQDELAARRRAGIEQVVLGPDGGAEGRHQLLAYGVERRVRDLREQLREVVEQQARPFRQHGDGRVGAHRPDRLGPGLGHGREQDLQLLVGVAEHLLAPQHRAVGVHDVLARGQVGQLHDAGVQPVLIRVLGREGRLDLGVVDDAALGRVDQEHAPGLEPALVHHRVRRDVDDAGLGRHHHQVVVGHPVAAGAKAVAVQHRADERAVGEGDGCGAVPRLHQRGVEAVEGTLGRVHGLVAFPGLGDHHEHGVGQAAAAEVEQLEGLVEAGRVGAARRADREDAFDVAGDEV